MRAVPVVAILVLAVAAQDKSPAQRGRAFYRAQACWQCHTQAKDRTFPVMTDLKRAGPVLDQVRQPRSRAWRLAMLFAPRAVLAESVMPAYPREFTPHGNQKAVREFLAKHDKDKDGVVTTIEMGGKDFPEGLDSTNNGIVSMADAAPVPSANLSALLDYMDAIDNSEVVAPAPPKQRKPRDARASVARGLSLYLRHCAGCHGKNADGNGAAAMFFPEHPPRNFVRGEFKFRSTMAPEPPTDRDLFRTIRGGAGPSMPAWSSLSDREVWDLVEFVKSHHRDYDKQKYDWQEDLAPEAIQIPVPPLRYTAESAFLGEKVYAEFGCANCHGASGKGDGVNVARVRGQIIRPTDYTRGARWLKGGADARSLVRSFLTGLHGTPMPAYATNFKAAKSAPPDRAPWHLAHFIMQQAKIPFDK